MTEAEAHQARKDAIAAHREAVREVRQTERYLQAAREAELVANQRVTDATAAWREVFDQELAAADRATRQQEETPT